jgi:hypothetical protein
MPIKFLWQLIFTFTFDKKSCAHCTKRIIEEQVCKWNGFVQINKVRELDKYGLDPLMVGVAVGHKGSALDEMEYQVGLMCSWLVREEKGEFESQVETYKKHKIDYHMAQPMCQVFPEYVSKHRNFAKGRAALQAAMKANPQDYAGPKKKGKVF